MDIFFLFFVYLGYPKVVYTKFQASTMSPSGQKVCCGGRWVAFETNFSVKLIKILFSRL